MQGGKKLANKKEAYLCISAMLRAREPKLLSREKAERMLDAATFEDAAKAYSEDAYLAYGYEWGLFTREQLSDEAEVLKLLPTLKVGDVTPPVESDGGLAILRMDASDDPDNVAFSRVFFRLPMFYTQETPAEARTALKEELSRELISETLKDVASKLKIEYPDGTNVFSSAALTPAEFSACDR